MANLSQIKFSDLKMPVGKLVKNLGWVFFGGLLILLVLEAFELNSSVQLILQSGQEPPLVNKEKGVRINFDNYNQVVNRIEQAPNFVPTDGITDDPFHGIGQRTSLPVTTPLPVPAPAPAATTTPTSTPGN